MGICALHVGHILSCMKIAKAFFSYFECLKGMKGLVNKWPIS
jgi:hypothetical protein